VQRDDRGDQDDLEVVQVRETPRSPTPELGAVSIEHAAGMVGLPRHHATCLNAQVLTRKRTKTRAARPDR
jgi:hypothetical protein